MLPIPTPIPIAILAFPESTASTIYGLYDLFLSAGRDWGVFVEGRPAQSPLAARVVSREGTPLAAVNGVRIVPDAAFETVETPEIVCVSDIAIAPDEPIAERFALEIAWLRDCHARGAILATACTGALLLAEAGLLDGLPATTHWAYCEAMARRYPAVQVQCQRALVVAGEGQRLVMAGGGSSWLDLGLFLIARRLGVETAMQTARMNLIDWHSVGQQPFASLAYARQTDDALIARCQAWIAEHYAQSAPVAAMADLAGLSERAFQRRFKQATGLGPLDYVQTLRLEESKHLLETTELPVEAVANECGYEDASYFGRLFRGKVGLTPAQYRKRFGTMRQTLADLSG